MSRLTYRGDSPNVAQQTLLPNPPAGFAGSIKIGISNKSIEFDTWSKSTIAAGWNSASSPEFKTARASVVDAGVLLTAATPGVPFLAWINYGGSSTFNEVVLISKANFSGSTSGTIDGLFAGESFTLDHDFDASDLQAELEALDAINQGDVVVEDVSDELIRVTFQGQFAGQNVSDLTLSGEDLRGGTADVSIESLRSYSAGQNEIQRIIIGGAPESGAIIYGLDGTPIGPVDFDADEAEYQTAFDDALGADNSEVTFVTDDGETGPLQKLFGTTKVNSDDGYATSESFETTGGMKIGHGIDSVGQIVSSMFMLIDLNGTLPGNVDLDLARLTLNRISSTPNAAVKVEIQAIDQASPLAIADDTDLLTRPLTTAKVVTTLYGSSNTIVLSTLAPIIQELMDSYGDLTKVLLHFKCIAPTTGNITFEDHSVGYVDGEGPRLEVHYRDGETGPTVIDVEFMGTLAETDLPLMTADISGLSPIRQNTIWQIDIVRDTGAPFGTPGSLQLFEGATLKHFAGTNDAPVAFDAAAVTVLDAYFGSANYQITNDPAIAGRVHVELIGDRAGATNIPADLVLYWFPYLLNGETGNPVARIEPINGGAEGLGQQQKLTISGDVFGGSLAIKIGTQTTATLNYGFTAANLQTALEALSNVGAGKVEVSGTLASGFLCEFDVTLGNVALMQVINNLKAVNVRVADQGYQQITTTDYRYTTQYQLVLVSNPGTVTLTGGGNVVNGDFYANAETVQNWFRTLFGNSVLSVSANGGTIQAIDSGGFSRTWGIILETVGQAGQISLNFPNQAYFGSEFQGNLTNQTSYVTSLAIVIDGTPTSGSWILNLNGLGGGIFATTTTLWNKTPAQIASTLSGVSGLEVTATGSSNAFTLSIVSQAALSGSVQNYTLAGTAPVPSVETTRPYEAVSNTRQKLIIDDFESLGGGYIELRHSGNAGVVYLPIDDQAIHTALNEIAALNGNVFVTGLAFNAWQIEFNGDLAGEDVALIQVTSYLDPIDPNGEFSTATWYRIQVGSNGASILITEQQKGSPAVGAQYRLFVLGDPHFGFYELTLTSIDGSTTFLAPVTTEPIEFDATATDNKTALEGLDGLGAGDVLVIGDLASGMLFDFNTSVGPITMSAADLNLTNSQIAALEYIPGGRLQASELVRSAGANHFDDPLNWRVVDTGESRIPNSGDVIIFESGRIPCLYGLRQRITFTVDPATNELILDQQADFRVGQTLMVKTSDTLPGGLDIAEAYTVAEYDRDSLRLKLTLAGVPVTINNYGGGTHTIRLVFDALLHRSRFTAAIGLPRMNAGGYQEYLPTSLEIGVDPDGQQLLQIGEGNGSSSGRMRFDVGGDQVFVEIHNTGGAIELGVPALVINGTNSSNEYEQLDGDVGLGFFEGDAFHFTKLRIHSGSLFYGRIYSSVACEFRNLGGSIDGREGTISGKISSKP
ncbi:hypothetical protein [Rubinisphaera italica]|uniref:Uncharacterized protein n=1 Tax=Rubinisphaera italica TaxID=2527969 RepID=A0A5C5XKX7_9PLAN|nr:hypothetical protein [Rubinisphaera italica]TWT63199.1 hypothetical protein Pan54_39520 [Rubinisphaera italica]